LGAAPTDAEELFDGGAINERAGQAAQLVTDLAEFAVSSTICCESAYEESATYSGCPQPKMRLATAIHAKNLDSTAIRAKNKFPPSEAL
jgi:hypothetical protein